MYVEFVVWYYDIVDVRMLWLMATANIHFSNVSNICGQFILETTYTQNGILHMSVYYYSVGLVILFSTHTQLQVYAVLCTNTFLISHKLLQPV